MKQEFEIPEGCKKVTIEQIGNQIVTTFKPKGKKRAKINKNFNLCKPENNE
jgi:hypothetical protein